MTHIQIVPSSSSSSILLRQESVLSSSTPSPTATSKDIVALVDRASAEDDHDVDGTSSWSSHKSDKGAVLHCTDASPAFEADEQPEYDQYDHDIDDNQNSFDPIEEIALAASDSNGQILIIDTVEAAQRLQKEQQQQQQTQYRNKATVSPKIRPPRPEDVGPKFPWRRQTKRRGRLQEAAKSMQASSSTPTTPKQQAPPPQPEAENGTIREKLSPTPSVLTGASGGGVLKSGSFANKNNNCNKHRNQASEEVENKSTWSGRVTFAKQRTVATYHEEHTDDDDDSAFESLTESNSILVYNNRDYDDESIPEEEDCRSSEPNYYAQWFGVSPLSSSFSLVARKSATRLLPPQQYEPNHYAQWFGSSPPSSYSSLAARKSVKRLPFLNFKGKGDSSLSRRQERKQKELLQQIMTNLMENIDGDDDELSLVQDVDGQASQVPESAASSAPTATHSAEPLAQSNIKRHRKQKKQKNKKKSKARKLQRQPDKGKVNARAVTETTTTHKTTTTGIVIVRSESTNEEGDSGGGGNLTKPDGIWTQYYRFLVCCPIPLGDSLTTKISETPST